MVTEKKFVFLKRGRLQGVYQHPTTIFLLAISTQHFTDLQTNHRVNFSRLGFYSDWVCNKIKEQDCFSQFLSHAMQTRLLPTKGQGIHSEGSIMTVRLLYLTDLGGRFKRVGFVESRTRFPNTNTFSKALNFIVHKR